MLWILISSFPPPFPQRESSRPPSSAIAFERLFQGQLGTQPSIRQLRLLEAELEHMRRRQASRLAREEESDPRDHDDDDDDNDDENDDDDDNDDDGMVDDQTNPSPEAPPRYMADDQTNPPPEAPPRYIVIQALVSAWNRFTWSHSNNT
jgi:hypothetical protein